MTRFPRLCAVNVVVATLWLALPLCGDHVPRSLVSRGNDEKVLAGITVLKTHIKDLLVKYGRPSTTTDDPPRGTAVGVRQYVWEEAGYKLTVTTEYAERPIFAGNQAEIVIAVRVEGNSGRAPIATGRGLRIGDSLADVKRLYGTRFQRTGQTLMIEWRSTASLVVELDSTSRIRTLYLSAPE